MAPLRLVLALLIVACLFLTFSMHILQNPLEVPFDHRAPHYNEEIKPLNSHFTKFLATFKESNPAEYDHLESLGSSDSPPQISKLTSYDPPTYSKVKILTRTCAKIILEEFDKTLASCFAATSNLKLTSLHHPDLDGSLVCGNTAWKSVDRSEVPLDQCPKTQATGWVYKMSGVMLTASKSHQVSTTRRTVHGEQCMANSASE